MSRVEFACPSCRSAVPGPPSLAGETTPCPRCGVGVTWPAPRSAPAPAARRPAPPPLPAAPPPVLIDVEHRDATPRASHGGGAFMTMLGGSLGCFAAVVLVCAGTIAFAVAGHGCKKTPDTRTPAERRGPSVTP